MEKVRIIKPRIFMVNSTEHSTETWQDDNSYLISLSVLITCLLGNVCIHIYIYTFKNNKIAPHSMIFKTCLTSIEQKFCRCPHWISNFILAFGFHTKTKSAFLCHYQRIIKVA